MSIAFETRLCKSLSLSFALMQLDGKKRNREEPSVLVHLSGESESETETETEEEEEESDENPPTTEDETDECRFCVHLRYACIPCGIDIHPECVNIRYPLPPTPVFNNYQNQAFQNPAFNMYQNQAFNTQPNSFFVQQPSGVASPSCRKEIIKVAVKVAATLILGVPGVIGLF